MKRLSLKLSTATFLLTNSLAFASGIPVEGKVIQTIEYTHPIFTERAIAAQQRHREINGARRTYFCGAYWRYGFHEDGVWSGARVAESLKLKSVVSC